MIFNIALALLFLTVLLIWYVCWYKKWVNQDNLLKIIIIVALIELFIAAPHAHADRYPQYTQPPYIGFLKEDTTNYRVVGLNGILYPNTAEAYGISDIRDLNAIYIDRYMKYIKANFDPTIFDRFDANSLLITPTNLKAMSLLNVKYFLTTGDIFNQISLNDNSIIPSINGTGSFYPGGNGYISFDPKNSPSSSMPHPRLILINVPNETSSLIFAIGTDPANWVPDRGDGVNFQIVSTEGNNERSLFSQYVDPSHKIEDLTWHRESSIYQNIVEKH